MPNLLPLRFKPILREYLWGGRRLGSELGKPIGAGDHGAESWEIVDHGADQSVVATGPWAGKTLHDMVTEHGKELFGRHDPLRQFPLLFKFLDACQVLSVQVHPNDAQGARLDPPDLGKTEAWVVLAADPGATIYAGLNEGVDRDELARAVEAGACERCLHSITPRVGDCILIEAGTVHALGGGLLIAEIQQASDTTFRLFDWNRVDKNGRPRPLHIRQALDITNYERGPVDPRPPQPTERPGVERLIACDKFILDRWRPDRAAKLVTNDGFHILTAIEGEVIVATDETSDTLRRGDTLLIPACCKQVQIQPQERPVFLDMYLP